MSLFSSIRELLFGPSVRLVRHDPNEVNRVTEKKLAEWKKEDWEVPPIPKERVIGPVIRGIGNIGEEFAKRRLAMHVTDAAIVIALDNPHTERFLERGGQIVCVCGERLKTICQLREHIEIIRVYEYNLFHPNDRVQSIPDGVTWPPDA